MSYAFTKKDIKKIADTLGVAIPTSVEGSYRFVIEDKEKRRRIALSIFPDLQIGGRAGNMAQLEMPIGIVQVHFCTNLVASKELGEVILVAVTKDKISGLAVSSDAGASFYANVDRDLLTKDLLSLKGEVMGCAMQLSLAEHLLDEIA
jgi:hypothetical protein